MNIILSIIASVIGLYWVVDSFSLIRKGSHRLKMPLLFSRKNSQIYSERQFNNEFLFGLIILGLGMLILTTSVVNPMQKVVFLILIYVLIDLRGTSVSHT